MGQPKHRVVVYTRRDCHLCDVARATIRSVRERHPFDLDEIDVDGDDALVRDHGYRVPVVTVDGVEVFEIAVDAEELEALVGGGSPTRATPR
jgi:glutaredoxin